MDSRIKAALISVSLVALVIVGCFVFFVERPEVAHDDQTETAPAATSESPTEQPAVESSAVPVTVQIVSKEDRSPLEAARLVVIGSGRTMKRSQGASHQLALEPGKYDLAVTCSGFSGADRSLVVLKGDAAKTEVFELERGVSISGRVLSTDGRPIAGADVAAFRGLGDPNADMEEALRAMVDIEKIAREEEHTTVSEEDGTYKIDGLDPLWYSIRALADGYAPGERDDVPAPSEDVDIVLDGGATLEGVVVDEKGEPIAGAEVLAKVESEDPEGEGVFNVILRKGRPPVDAATTDGAGRFRLSRLGAGLYNFKVRATGYWDSVEMAVRLASGENPPRTFTLQAGAVIKGILQTLEGEPIEGAEAQLVPFRSHERNQRFDLVFREPVTTDAEGRFLFHSLENVRHLITFYHKNYRTVANKKALPSDEDLIFTMKPGPRLEGRVIAADTEEPVVGATITVNDPGDRMRTAITDDEGNYVISGITKTKRRLIAYVDADGYGNTEREFNPRAGDLVIEDFTLEPAATMRGRVVAGGAPASYARVEVKRVGDGASMERIRHTGFTDAQGLFELTDLDPGTPVVLRVKQRAFIDYSTDPFELAPGEVVELEDIVLVRGGEISGRVVDSAGNPISDCVVEARPEGATEVDPEGTIRGTAAADGRYLLQGLRPGVVDLVFQAPGYVTLVRPVEARTDFRNRQDDAELTPASVIHGRVVDPAGQGVGGARVTAWEFIDGVKEHRASTLPNGEFRLEGLASVETVEFDVSHPSFESFSNDELAVNNEEPVQVTLNPLGMLKGFVIGPDGVTIPDFVVELKTPQSAGRPLKKQRYKDGSFELRGIPNGVYDIYVLAPKYDPYVRRGVRISTHSAIDFGRFKLPAR